MQSWRTAPDVVRTSRRTIRSTYDLRPSHRRAPTRRGTPGGALSSSAHLTPVPVVGPVPRPQQSFLRLEAPRTLPERTRRARRVRAAAKGRRRTGESNRSGLKPIGSKASVDRRGTSRKARAGLGGRSQEPSRRLLLKSRCTPNGSGIRSGGPPQGWNRFSRRNNPQLYRDGSRDSRDRVRHGHHGTQTARRPAHAVAEDGSRWRLAGGAAHDFNNMLTIISGYDRMLLGELSTVNPLRGYAEESGTPWPPASVRWSSSAGITTASSPFT
jgi:hypothetical protein